MPRSTPSTIRPKARAQAQAGFTLVEVVVALTILAVGVIAVLQLFPLAQTQARKANEKSMVASLATTELGRVRAGGVGNSLSDWAVENALKQLNEQERAYALYDSWRSSVQRVSGDVDLYRVTFNVRLFDGAEEKFVTYVTQP